ncbi:MAG: hypothetical protein A4S09_09605 [Proteobacteria bacterium SG_bin7]|nr:MAG: hypothetical protein A4S09_09605 [Proteobacteria bacterium SG_bin7]
MKKASILVIDDSVDTLELQRKSLELEGYRVFTSQCGSDALTLLSALQKSQELNLILLDMNLGDMTGSEFLKILEKTNLEIFNNVPIVFFSGADEIPKSKAIGFIRKPIDLEKFIQDIRHFIEMGTHALFAH